MKSEKLKNMTDEQIADKWIKEMEEMGMTPEQMLKCIRMAKEKYEQIQNKL